MILKSVNSLGVLGYLLIVNNEIHSRQIKMLSIISARFEIIETDIIQEIINDKEEKMPYNDCIMAFQNEDKETKELIYKSCFQLAIIDDDNLVSNLPDSKEGAILKDLESYMDNSDISLLRSQSVKELNKNDYLETSNDSNLFNIDFESLLNVASDDYKIFNSVSRRLFSECQMLSSHLETKLNTIKMPVLKTALSSFIKEYKENVMTALSDLKGSLERKELAAQNFSIALMGRTKAGKSTLHYIMCDDGREFIGKGAQRTTRYNRVFCWNNIKIIDTPGIGAGEEEGKKDEKIALSVLSQADVICFVIIDDTIQNDILELLNTIAEYHKPMLIVLNHKEDIRKKSHLKTFMNNPDDWRLTTGESNLAGYINRLKRNAEKNNYDQLMKIVPVFLLAAQIGKENNDSVIFNASNYQEFIESIGTIISDNNIIYKSQTILDEPSIRLHKALSILEKEKSKLIALRDKVKRIRKSTLKSIASSLKTVLSESELSIKTQFDDFYTAKSYEYAEKYYKEKSVINLNNAYNKMLEEYRVREKINSIISNYISTYQNKLSAIVSEIDEELNYAKLNVDNMFGDDSATITGNRSTISFKEIIKVATMILDVISIAYPILAVISIPLSLFGGFLKSKEQKINDAKEFTLQNFTKLSNYSKEQTIKKSKESIRKLFKDDEIEITKFFDTFEEQLNEIIEFVTNCCSEFEKGIGKIDMSLAGRILQYISNNSGNYNVVKTNRDLLNNVFTIYVQTDDIRIKPELKKYQNISTETIRIKYI